MKKFKDLTELGIFVGSVFSDKDTRLEIATEIGDNMENELTLKRDMYIPYDTGYMTTHTKVSDIMDGLNSMRIRLTSLTDYAVYQYWTNPRGKTLWFEKAEMRKREENLNIIIKVYMSKF